MGRLTLDLPAEWIAILGSSPEQAATQARLAVVLDLLRSGQITQGQAAQALGLSRWDLLDLMVRHHISSGPETPAELQQEVEAAERYFREHGQ